MVLNVTQGLSNFFDIFTFLYNWIASITFVIGELQFTMVDLIVSIIFLSLFITFIFRLITGD